MSFLKVTVDDNNGIFMWWPVIVRELSPLIDDKLYLRPKIGSKINHHSYDGGVRPSCLIPSWVVVWISPQLCLPWSWSGLSVAVCHSSGWKDLLNQYFLSELLSLFSFICPNFFNSNSKVFNDCTVHTHFPVVLIPIILEWMENLVQFLLIRV